MNAPLINYFGNPKWLFYDLKFIFDHSNLTLTYSFINSILLTFVWWGVCVYLGSEGGRSSVGGWCRGVRCRSGGGSSSRVYAVGCPIGHGTRTSKPIRLANVVGRNELLVILHLWNQNTHTNILKITEDKGKKIIVEEAIKCTTTIIGSPART